MSHLTLKLLPALAIATTAMLVTQPMRAGAIDSLLITENSSTSLTAILNGTPLTVTLAGSQSGDFWAISLPGVNTASLRDADGFWTEPDASGALGFVNDVRYIAGPITGNTLLVLSDVGPGIFGGLADGATNTGTFTYNGNPLAVTFFDKGDVATVPDTGTSASLLGVSLAAVAFLRRKFSGHLPD